ncbi:hypothetical protein [Chryseobacterium sp. CFBP8996]|uniref:hypothetical protein n=1 Tax=Chryseobacterium sp. CFBP8996 TaxID=3096529 RepID=UPI002A6AEF1B|nr:hypothetical protein [Chryseobacterium sp. CFBP8996]MDY0931775.1 hypothetical protein [Chryseobacterium sp. CFBP8996]
MLFIVVLQQTFAQTFQNFITAGNQDQYVPVVFRSVTSDGGNRTFFISRPGVHETRTWLAHGILSITGIGNGWGSNGNSLRVDNFTYGIDGPTHSGNIISFAGRILCAQENNDIIVYLRGGTLYYYGNAEIIRNNGTYQDATGQSLTTVSITDPLYNLPKGTYYGTNDINAKTSNFAAIENGNVGIGISNPTNKLDVNGVIHAKEVKVDLQNWPDYVFKKGYNLMSLKEIEDFISKNGHLPNMPSATKVENEGAKLGEISLKLVEKIEELTLHSINQSKTIEGQNKKISDLESKIEKLILNQK